MTRVSATRTLEKYDDGWVQPCVRRRRGRARLPGPALWRPGRRPRSEPPHSYLSDSKAVPPAEREDLFEQITSRALAWAVAEASPDEIDTINIHQASLQAMRRAVMSLAPLPDLVLVDAFRIPDLMIAQRGVVHGDQRCSALRQHRSSPK